jgi:hypothetical protein
VARARRGTQFDPALVDMLQAEAEGLFAELDSVTAWDAVMSVAPDLGAALTDAELDSALEAVADFVDLKSPYTISTRPTRSRPTCVPRPSPGGWTARPSKPSSRPPATRSAGAGSGRAG